MLPRASTFGVMSGVFLRCSGQSKSKIKTLIPASLPLAGTTWGGLAALSYVINNNIPALILKFY